MDFEKFNPTDLHRVVKDNVNELFWGWMKYRIKLKKGYLQGRIAATKIKGQDELVQLGIYFAQLQMLEEVENYPNQVLGIPKQSSDLTTLTKGDL